MNRNIKELVSQMTLEEKAGLCSGLDAWHTKPVERLGIPSVMVSDGPHGLRKEDPAKKTGALGGSIDAVCFPAACATASSFDPELIEEMGKTLGQECQAEDVSILLGPAVNIKRSPLCGRNFEYLSEDPYLAGKMAAAYIRGVQSQGIGTSIKHFAANNQEYRRMTCDSQVSERALREIYFPAFETAVKEAQPQTVMCSYNKINGTYASENRWLLTEVLRDEWGFEGYVMTDWGAVNDRVKGILAGLDLEMPGSGGHNDRNIVKAVQAGELDEAVLDATVERILKVIFSYLDARQPGAVFDKTADHEKATEFETECAVLLENNGILPLKAGQKVVYIGEYAEKPRYQGGGSSHIETSRVTSALDAAKAKGRQVSYVKGFAADQNIPDEAAIQSAVEAAKNADVVVIFAGLPDSFESEGMDRKNMAMPACQTALIEAVAAVQPNTVVVLHNGSPVECHWAEKVAAILEMYLGGQGVGEATDRLLYGEANPCGRLAETFPLRLEDTPCYLCFPGDGKSVHYDEGVFVGYRYYDAKKLPVRWAFGHGLSYTTFSYANLKLSSDTLDDTGSVTVSVDVTNTGKMAGKEVVQLYVSDRNGTPERPVKELKGFAKVSLAPGETKSVTMTLAARDLSYYREDIHDWYAPSGTYELLIGHASDEIVLTATLGFTTKKIVPFIVTRTSTIGELMAHPATAAMFTQFSSAAMSGAGLDMESTGLGELMAGEVAQELINGMPLKSLFGAFFHTDEDLTDFITVMNGAIQAATQNNAKDSYKANDHYRKITPEDTFGFCAAHPVFEGNRTLFFNANDTYLAMCAGLSLRGYHEALKQADQSETVAEGMNYLIEQAEAGKVHIITDIYPAADIDTDPDKAHVKGVLYQGERGKPMALIIPGGGFEVGCAYVEGFPEAKELHKKGYSVFVLAYRVGEWLHKGDMEAKGKEAATDVAPAVRWLMNHQQQYGYTMEGYSIWGFSAGGMMITAFCFSKFGANCKASGLPMPTAIFPIYGLHWDTEASAEDEGIAVFSRVGRTDAFGFGNIENKVPELKSVLGEANVDICVYDDLAHGFGTGKGTVAEGWMEDAVKFWENFR